MSNRDRLRAILGNNPTANCSPQSQIPNRILRNAKQQADQRTAQRYGNLLQFVQRILQTVLHLSSQQTNQAINALGDWLQRDDPLGTIRSLQNGQLFNLLGEVAPVIAQWLSENLNLLSAGGSRGRKGGYSQVRNFSPSQPGNFSSVTAGLVTALANAFGGGGFGGGGFGADVPSFNEPGIGGLPSGPSTAGGTSTVVIPSGSGGTSDTYAPGEGPNVEEIPSVTYGGATGYEGYGVDYGD
jgi:hypothetical protein